MPEEKRYNNIIDMNMKSVTLCSYLAAALALQGAAAFVPSIRLGMHQQNTGYRSQFSFQLASSVQPPTTPHSASNSDKDANEDEHGLVWESPYDDLFRSQLQYRQHGTIQNISKAQYKQKKFGNVHIIIFNQGLQTEGIHTIVYPRNSGSNVILAFESINDAKRFAKNLGSQMDSLPMPHKIPARNLNSYANSLGMAVQVVPAGINLKPPDRNYDKSGLGGGLREQAPLLMKLKEEKTYLDRLLGSSPTSSGGVGEFGGSPTWG